MLLQGFSLEAKPAAMVTEENFTPSFLDQYRRVDLPRKLWRVTHRNTNSRIQDGDMVAADPERELRNALDLKNAVQNHINWRSRQPSCFLSVFTDADHAHNWAWKTRAPVRIYEIKTDSLPASTYILDVEVIVKTLNIDYRYSANELLILHRIPLSAITSQSLADWARARYCVVDVNSTPFDRCQIPSGHVHSDSSEFEGDDSNTDDSAEEHNGDDDLVKGMEGSLWKEFNPAACQKAGEHHAAAPMSGIGITTGKPMGQYTRNLHILKHDAINRAPAPVMQ
ncbi:hypothetical protein VTK26DRAFT_2985 [Humicola hyalothermophila]